jgi:hypothetical protein
MHQIPKGVFEVFRAINIVSVGCSTDEFLQFYRVCRYSTFFRYFPYRCFCNIFVIFLFAFGQIPAIVSPYQKDVSGFDGENSYCGID